MLYSVRLTSKASVLPSEKTEDGGLVRDQETEQTKQCRVTQSLSQVTLGGCGLEEETFILLGCNGNCHLTAEWFTHAAPVLDVGILHLHLVVGHINILVVER